MIGRKKLTLFVLGTIWTAGGQNVDVPVDRVVHIHHADRAGRIVQLHRCSAQRIALTVKALNLNLDVLFAVLLGKAHHGKARGIVVPAHFKVPHECALRRNAIKFNEVRNVAVGINGAQKHVAHVVRLRIGLVKHIRGLTERHHTVKAQRGIAVLVNNLLDLPQLSHGLTVVASIEVLGLAEQGPRRAPVSHKIGGIQAGHIVELDFAICVATAPTDFNRLGILS